MIADDLRQLPNRATPSRYVELLATEYELGFSRSDLQTIGLEEELILVDPGSLEPCASAAWVVDALADPRFSVELRSAQIELITPICLAVADLTRELAACRARLEGWLDGRLAVLSAGTHPRSHSPIAISERPRYKRIASEHPWITRRGIPSGLHIHIAVGDPDEALAVYNAARDYLPELAALSANSPFIEGSDSGLASARLKLLDDGPRSGVPPVFVSWRDFAEFVAWGALGEMFSDLTFLWWDLRPRPDLGTLEFRVADTQLSLSNTAAIAATCQALVAMLRDRFRNGELSDPTPTHLIAERRWRAIRDGMSAELVDPQSGTAQPAYQRLAGLIAELGPYADELACGAELELAWPLIDLNGAQQQRAVAAEHGVSGLVEWLVKPQYAN